MLGYEHVYAPLPRKHFPNKNIAFTNVPIIIVVGATTKKAMVVNNEILIRDVIHVTFTLDHRYTDGAAAAPAYQKFVKYLHNPELAEMAA